VDECKPLVVGTLPHYNFARKGASDSGWDWGPAFSPAGVYTAPRLVARSAMLLTDVVVSQVVSEDGSGALLAVRCVLAAPPPLPAAAWAGVAAAGAGGDDPKLSIPEAACLTFAVEGMTLPANVSHAVVHARPRPPPPPGGAAAGGGQGQEAEVLYDHYMAGPVTSSSTFETLVFYKHWHHMTW